MESLSIIIGFLIGFIFLNQFYAAVSFAALFFCGYRIFAKSSNQLVFRELAVFFYCINYLVSPSLTYFLLKNEGLYSMKVDHSVYLPMATLGLFFFVIGMYLIPTSLFRVNYKELKVLVTANKKSIVNITLISTLLSLTTSNFPSSIEFFIYLISLLRFVGAFLLFTLNDESWIYSFFILLLEITKAFVSSSFHDAYMWMIFFTVFYLNFRKPSVMVKLISLFSFVFLTLFIQATKGGYRELVWYGDGKAGIKAVSEVGGKLLTNNLITDESNLMSSLTRANQGWIFASTIDNMDRNKEFQGLSVVKQYFEAALIPRLLSPNKIKSGDINIFNQFSGHTISEGTSMGLGVFADGYIAYGEIGVYIFGFILGLLFLLVFKFVERWSRISPLYILFFFPLLNFAVRPDCESQTIINHVFKGVLVYGVLISLTRKRILLNPLPATIEELRTNI